MAEDNWMHRATMMTCSCCMWFVQKKRLIPKPNMTTIMDPFVKTEPNPGPWLGRCRRHAPTLGGWPAIWDGDWCGDHKLDENKI